MPRDHIGRHRSAAWTPGLAVATLSFIIVLLTTVRQVGVYDEGIILTGGARMMAGELPSRDFYTNYGPGQFLLSGIAFKVFGHTMLVARILDALQLAIVIALCWSVTRSVASTSIALPGALCALAMALTSRSPLFPLVPATALSILAAWVTARRLAQPPRRFEYLVPSLIIGAVSLFRYDVAVLVGLALGFAVLYIRWRQYRSGQVGHPAIWRSIRGYSTCLAMTASLVIILLLICGMFPYTVRDLFVYNSSNYVAMRNLPFPRLSDINGMPSGALVYLSPVIVLGAAIVVSTTGLRAHAVRAQSAFDGRLILLVCFASLSAALFAKGLVRTSPLHMLGGNLAAVPAACAAFAIILDRTTAPRGLGRRTAQFAFLALALLWFGAVFELDVAERNVRSVFDSKSRSEPRRIWPLDVEDHRLAALRDLAARVKEGERILSVTGRHDKVFVNDISAYWLLDRLPGTRWHHFDPGVQTSRAVQREMIEEAERLEVRTILRDRTWDHVEERNLSALSSGVGAFDDYLSSNFDLVASYGSVDILTRKPAR
ncbi:MAG TPA: glycosyltransferase family 39 protein [Salinarimonas sp.]|nr:glycosyltransferase family 39 protein [Salinarimonas sp.]